MARCFHVVALLLGLGVAVLPGSAQIARELPVGTTMDATVRAYGWPKRTAVRGTTEIWGYDGFQVTFVEGKVESVSALPASKQRSTGVVPKAHSPNWRPQPNTSVSAPGTPAATTPTAPRKTGIPPGTSAMPPGRNQSRPTGTSAPAEPPLQATGKVGEKVSGESGAPLRPLVYVLGFAAAALVCVGTLIIMRRRSSIDLVFEQSRKTQPPVPDAAQQTAAKDWKATVAERLERQQRKESREGSVANTMPSVDTATEHIWERRHTSTEAGANGMAGPPQSVPATELTRDLLLELEWKRFELLVARYFAATGMRAELTKTGADGGVDIYIYEEREGGPCGFVQCKAHGPDKFIVAEQVRALFGVMMAARVSRGFFVTTAQFGKEALAFAAQNGIEAIDGHELLTRFSRLEPEAKARIVSEVTAGDYRTPTCPTHDVKMVLRNRKANGVAFWACARPGCKRIINVRG